MDAFLFLKNGRCFAGESFGSGGDVCGELVFNTSAIGVLELLSDPVSAGEIVMQTFPMAGNYGSIEEDIRDGRLCCAGFIAREWCFEPSNFRSSGTLDELMKKHGVTGICGIDTRAVTRILREEGTMSALITCSPELSAEQKALLESFERKGLSAKLGVKELCEKSAPGASLKAAVLDLGAGDSCANALLSFGVSACLLPYDYAAEDILKLGVGGLVISDGPGEARFEEETARKLKALAGKLPVFGIGLGHEVLAAALGGRIEKLPGGHRGANQPVREMETGRVYITTQNHGSAVSEIPEGAVVTYKNEHDGTVEGLEYPCNRAMSVAFLPCSDGSANDMSAIWTKFIAMMGGEH